jgi:hypothetical protein
MTGPLSRARRVLQGNRVRQGNRAYRALAFGAAALAVVAAVAAFLLTGGGTSAKPRPSPLASNITSEQAVGLANPGPPQAGGAATLLSESQSGLTFMPGSPEDVTPSQQWQADQVGGGAYILVFTPGGQCLTATSTRQGGAASLQVCNLGLSQRWSHLYLGTDPAGRSYWQLRNAADGRCLAVGGTQPDGGTGAAMQRCSSSMPWQELITFPVAF